MHLARKGIGEEGGCELARMLKTNKTLRKLELEGNLLGPNSAKYFGLALKENKTLLFLDLESNQLTIEGSDPKGINEFIGGLTKNKHLLSLNLANNKLNKEQG